MKDCERLVNRTRCSQCVKAAQKIHLVFVVTAAKVTHLCFVTAF